MTKARRNRVRRLVLAYLEQLGADIEALGDDLFRVEMAPEQSGELEGGWVPPSGPWSPQGPAQVTYYFTFTPEVAEAHEEVELIGLGSHRLQQVIQSIRKIGGATRVWLPAPPMHAGRGAPAPNGGTGVSYRPFYLFTLRLDFVGAAKPSDVLRVAVDRVDQIALTQLAEVVRDLPLESGFPAPDGDSNVERADLDYGRSFAVAYDGALQLLEATDPAWANLAQRSIDRERERLVDYYALRERDGEEVAREREQRLRELDATRPKVIVRVQGVTDLYLPIAWENGTARHLAFDMAAYLGAPIPSAR